MQAFKRSVVHPRENSYSETLTGKGRSQMSEAIKKKKVNKWIQQERCAIFFLKKRKI